METDEDGENILRDDHEDAGIERLVTSRDQAPNGAGFAMYRVELTGFVWTRADLNTADMLCRMRAEIDQQLEAFG